MKRLALIWMLMLAAESFSLNLEEIWISGAERKAKTVAKTDFELAVGSGENQVGYEREEGLTGWLYDIGQEKKYEFARVRYSDRYRGMWDISWQTASLTLGKDFRLGGAFTGEHYERWRGMAVVEVDFKRPWIEMSVSYMTDFSQLRWNISGGPLVKLSKRLSLQWKIDHWGDAENDYGGSKVVVKYKININ